MKLSDFLINANADYESEIIKSLIEQISDQSKNSKLPFSAVLQATLVHNLRGRSARVSNPAHALGRRDGLRPQQVVHEERVRRQDRKAESGSGSVGRMVQVCH